MTPGTSARQLGPVLAPSVSAVSINALSTAIHFSTTIASRYRTCRTRETRSHRFVNAEQGDEGRQERRDRMERIGAATGFMKWCSQRKLPIRMPSGIAITALQRMPGRCATSSGIRWPRDVLSPEARKGFHYAGRWRERKARNPIRSADTVKSPSASQLRIVFRLVSADRIDLLPPFSLPPPAGVVKPCAPLD